MAKTIKKKKALPKEMEAHKWKKGQSGNPNGRPKVIPKLEVLLRAALGTTSDNPEDSEIFKILKSLVGDAKDKKSRHKSRAAEILLDRAFGKAVEKVKDEAEETESKEKTINVIADQKRIDELTKSKPKDK